MMCPEPLLGRRGVVIDTNIFIYLFEDDPRFGMTAEFIIEHVEAGSFLAVATPITIAEVIIKPLEKNRPDLADRCRSALRRVKNLDCVGITFEIGEIAGALKAKYGMPLPDMIQAAVAMQAQKPALITNDRRIAQIEEVDVFLLKAFTS